MAEPKVRIIRVFVSSPNDVAEERSIVDKVVASIDRVEGPQCNMRMEVFRWEQNVVPRLGDTPQRVVDEQTPAFQIYLGIMSTRFGTPTDKYGSGTEAEFRAALNQNMQVGRPWILFYFRDDPVVPRVGDGPREYVRVCDFRQELESKGIVCGYACVNPTSEPGRSDASFFEKVHEHLRQLVYKLGEPQGEYPTRLSIPPGYLDWLQDDCAGIDLLGLRLKEGQALRLTQVYVPLITPRTGDEFAVIRRSASPTERKEKPQLLLDLLDRSSLYVSGPPGSGKSTFARWVAWLCCRGELPTGKLQGPEGYCESYPESLRGRLPLLVRLRDFHEALPKTPGCDSLTLARFEKCLADWLAARKPGGLTWDCLERHLRDGKALLIFDGVDEVPLDDGGPHRPWYPRAMLLAGLAEAAKAWGRSNNRILVTSRPYGLDGADRDRLGLPHAPLSDLDDTLQRLLVRRWFGILADDQAKGDQMADEFRGHVQLRQDIGELLASPMLLTAVCIIFKEGARLPQDRHELYDRIVENVLYARFRTKPLISMHRKRLCVIAHAMHTGEGLGESRTTPQAEASVAEVDRALSSYQERKLYTEEGFLGVTQTREKLLSDSGLLLPRDGNRAAFYHLSIQEHLAAQWLLDREEADLAPIFASRSAVREWRETLSFAFGALLARYEEPTKSVQLLESLLERMTPEDVRLQVVVADCLQVLLGRNLRLREPSQQKFREACLSAIEREVELADRHILGLALGRIGDPRVVLDLRTRDPRAFVRIEAGEYAYQEGRQTIEQPFLLSRYPVTNSQYAEFVSDNGYQDRKYWSDDGWAWKVANNVTLPDRWHHPRWNGQNQPVVGVSWYEADAFCRWAGGQLPSEGQWEAAARGTSGREYPWGDKWEGGICNSLEARLRVTSAVGLFPRSRTPEGGLEDMAGNVDEWCVSAWDKSGAARVVRGGGWISNAWGVRCAFRYANEPSDRSGYLGFRLSGVPQTSQASQPESPPEAARASGGR